jgi:hypothetical protein
MEGRVDAAVMNVSQTAKNVYLISFPLVNGSRNEFCYNEYEPDC